MNWMRIFKQCLAAFVLFLISMREYETLHQSEDRQLFISYSRRLSYGGDSLAHYFEQGYMIVLCILVLI